MDAEDTADELSSFFGSVFCEETFGPMEEDCYKSHFGCIIDDMNIDIDDVKGEGGVPWVQIIENELEYLADRGGHGGHLGEKFVKKYCS